MAGSTSQSCRAVKVGGIMKSMGHKVQIGGREYSRGEIARGTGMSMSHISRVFSGQRVPSMKTIERIAQFAGMSAAALICYLPSTRAAQ